MAVTGRAGVAWRSCELVADARACAAKHGASGKVIVQLEINYRGRIVDAFVRDAAAELSDCVAAALAPARFPPSRTGARAGVPIEL